MLSLTVSVLILALFVILIPVIIWLIASAVNKGSCENELDKCGTDKACVDNTNTDCQPYMPTPATIIAMVIIGVLILVVGLVCICRCYPRAFAIMSFTNTTARSSTPQTYSASIQSINYGGGMPNSIKNGMRNNKLMSSYMEGKNNDPFTSIPPEDIGEYPVKQKQSTMLFDNDSKIASSPYLLLVSSTSPSKSQSSTSPWTSQSSASSPSLPVYEESQSMMKQEPLTLQVPVKHRDSSITTSSPFAVMSIGTDGMMTNMDSPFDSKTPVN